MLLLNLTDNYDENSNMLALEAENKNNGKCFCLFSSSVIMNL